MTVRLALLFGFIFSAFASAPASAALLDRFDCAAVLTSHDGVTTLVSNGLFDSPRVPILPDPDWIDGIAATDGSLTMSLGHGAGSERLEVIVDFRYVHAVKSASQQGSRAAMESCLLISTSYRDGGLAESCGETVGVPLWDPTALWSPVEMTARGPRFDVSQQPRRTVSLSHLNHPIWASFSVNCSYLGVR